MDKSSFLKEVTKIICHDGVLIQGKRFEDLCKDSTPTNQKPFAFLYPEKTSQIQSLVRLATSYNISLWFYSTAKNWGYGNTTIEKNAIIVILSRMNKILHVDEKLAYVVLEPGVTFKQLRDYIEEKNIKLWTDSPGGPPTGSVIGNALDRGCGVTKYSDHYSHLCGLEVVLADGSLLSTGAAAPDLSITNYLYRWGVGPQIDGLFSQSNYGVITKAGVQLMPKPQFYSILSFKVDSDEKLADTIDCVRESVLKGEHAPTGRFSNDVAMMTLITQAISEPKICKRALDHHDLNYLRKKYNISQWTGSMGTYGPKPLVKLQSKLVRKRLKAVTKVTSLTQTKLNLLIQLFRVTNSLSSRPLKNILNNLLCWAYQISTPIAELLEGLKSLHEGIPSETVVKRAYFRSHHPRPTKDINIPIDGIGLLWVAPVLPFDGKKVKDYISWAKNLFKQNEFDFFMTIIILNERSLCPLVAILYDRNDRYECERANELYNKLIKGAQKMGYQQYRAGFSGWEMLFDSNPENRELLNKLKSALDPHNIFAPGRYGIRSE